MRPTSRWASQQTTTTEAPVNVPADPLEFSRQVLNFQPDRHQARIFDPSIKRGLLCCTRQFGKSTCIASLALHTALSQPASTTLILAPHRDQSGEFLAKIYPHLESLGIPLRRAPHHRDSILLPNGSRILAITDTDTAARSYTAHLVVIDEAGLINDAAVRAVRASLSTTNGTMWIIGTPKGRQGIFYDLWTNNDLPYFRLLVTAYECERIPPEFLAEERIVLGELMFGQEYLCEFQAAHNAVFDDAILRKALFDPDLPRPGIGISTRHYIIGVDFGKVVDPTAVVIVEVNDLILSGMNYITWERHRTREYTLRHIERLPLKSLYPEIVSRIRQIVNLPEYKGQSTLILDSTGVGEPAIDLLKASDLSCPMQKFLFTADSKRDVILNLRTMFDMNEIRIPNNLAYTDQLFRELNAMRAETIGTTGNVRYGARSGEHDDLVTALSLAMWQSRPRVPTVGEKGGRVIFS